MGKSVKIENKKKRKLKIEKSANFKCKKNFWKKMRTNIEKRSMVLRFSNFDCKVIFKLYAVYFPSYKMSQKRNYF